MSAWITATNALATKTIDFTHDGDAYSIDAWGIADVPWVKVPQGSLPQRMILPAGNGRQTRGGSERLAYNRLQVDWVVSDILIMEAVKKANAERVMPFLMAYTEAYHEMLVSTPNIEGFTVIDAVPYIGIMSWPTGTQTSWHSATIELVLRAVYC